MIQMATEFVDDLTERKLDFLQLWTQPSILVSRKSGEQPVFG